MNIHKQVGPTVQILIDCKCEFHNVSFCHTIHLNMHFVFQFIHNKFRWRNIHKSNTGANNRPVLFLTCDRLWRRYTISSFIARYWRHFPASWFYACANYDTGSSSTSWCCRRQYDGDNNWCGCRSVAGYHFDNDRLYSLEVTFSLWFIIFLYHCVTCIHLYQNCTVITLTKYSTILWMHNVVNNDSLR